jgi:HlyD family secretion protein
MTTEQDPTRRNIRRHIAIGGAAFAVLAFGLAGWAATTDISGAVVAPGVLVVETNVKKVQHPTGGVVGEILVRDGASVKAGDVVVRLDDTVTRANLAIVTKSLDELAARQARLRAERDDLSSIAFPRELVARSTSSQVREIIEEEQKLFEVRASARSGQKAQLQERVGQLQEELSGLAAQTDAKEKEIAFVHRELEGVRELWKKNLIPITRLMLLEREAVRIEGERGNLLATSAQAKGKITEIGLQIAQIDRDLKSEATKELREIQGKVAELVERKVAAEDQLKRVDIIAPQSGVVHQLAVHTVGGVIGPGEQLMLVVPGSDELTVEVRVAPQDIDQLQIGQRAVLRFAAFNQRTTPEIAGHLRVVSADIAQDQKTGVSYYLGRIGIPPAEVARLKGLKLVPGMPVETFLQTQDRTVLSYLVKPLEDQIVKAFRER